MTEASLTILETGSPRSWHCYGHVLIEALFLVGRDASSLCPPVVGETGGSLEPLFKIFIYLFGCTGS